jgi:cyclopropane-fatty-acyl-phospholipid synthase
MFRSPVERTHLFQIVFSKGNITDRDYPMGRGFLYDGAPGSGGASA